jgi:hypothetical protein
MNTPTVLSITTDFAVAARHHQTVSDVWARHVDAAMTSQSMDRFEAEVLADDARVMRDMHAALAETVQQCAEDRFGREAFAAALDVLDGGGTLPLFPNGGDGWDWPSEVAIADEGQELPL